MRSLNRSSQNIQKRLSKLFASRELNPTFIDEQETQVLINPPDFALRPIIRGGVVLIVIVGAFWWLNKPAEMSQVTALSNQSTTNQHSENQFGEVVVHVAGEVNQPGLVKLPTGSRVMDAITAAGGFISPESVGNLNLAAHLEDGQLIYVGPDSQAPNDSRINLNTASVSQLEDLPGVGPVMANRIIDWRTKHNRFSSIEELQEVEGIGPKLFNRLRELVRV